jgi:hypothetical protein
MRCFSCFAGGHLLGLFFFVLFGALEGLIAETFVLFGAHCAASVHLRPARFAKVYFG